MKLPFWCAFCCLAVCLRSVESLDLVEQLEAIYEKADTLLSSLKDELQQHTNRSHKTINLLPTSCLTPAIARSGLHTVEVPGLEPFAVFCETQLAGPGWTVIQRRTNGSLNFFRNWEEYKQGFGDLEGEFFLGLEKVRALTALEPFELYVHLEDFDGERRHARFDEFALGSEEDAYALNALGRYTGTAGDSLRSHRKMKFSTYDRDNDQEFTKNCAFYYLGGWWYNACVDSNLNGQYVQGGKYEEKMFARGMCWRAWRGHNYGYKVTQMMIRPKCRNIPKP
ncbi:ficolin-1 [Drosophila obscura]|uniref:ficolin-1 n=1 Tax=Drosophila obscura TaxID=7282 RepID=UPI001BB1FA6B|nr:ficolin-1 [Drosophila obscura]